MELFQVCLFWEIKRFTSYIKLNIFYPVQKQVQLFLVEERLYGKQRRGMCLLYTASQEL